MPCRLFIQSVKDRLESPPSPTPPGPYLSLTSANAAFSSVLTQPCSAPQPHLPLTVLCLFNCLLSKEAGAPFRASEGVLQWKGVKKLQHRERGGKNHGVWLLVLKEERQTFCSIALNSSLSCIQNKGTKAGAHKVTIFTPEALEKRCYRSPSPYKWSLL